MRFRVLLILVVCAVAGAQLGCQSGRNTVVWISIDGFRCDYPDKTDTPTLHRLMREGAYSRDLVTITPSLTFPSHVSEATGVPAAVHGIPSNDFYDTATNQLYKFPSEAKLLQAEPIWLTAHRQGIRTLVYDWPMSYGVGCDYDRATFDAKLTDAQRLDAILHTWRSDRPRDANSLRLLMGYIKDPDTNGHKFGPDSKEIVDTIARTDALLGNFISQASDIFRQTARPHDRLYILITTDHGMMPVTQLVNADALVASPQARIVTSGPLALVYLDQIPAAERSRTIDRILTRVKGYDFADAYTHQTLPRQWRFDHSTRVGEITLMLRPGYSFSTKQPATTFSVESANGPRGMHGYPLSDVKEMRGFCVLWRHPKPLGGKNLGEVKAEQFAPMVAKLLGIKPARR